MPPWKMLRGESSDGSRQRIPLSGLFGHDMLADPYPVYHRLRSTAPFVWVESFQGWVLTRHEDVSAVLRRRAFLGAAVRRHGRAGCEGAGSMKSPRCSAWRMNAMLSCDAPRHTRLRSLVSEAFTPRAVAALRPTIATLVDQLLDEALARAGGSDPGPGRSPARRRDRRDARDSA